MDKQEYKKRNTQVIQRKIAEGIRFVQEQDKKLTPVIDYLTQMCIEQKEKLPPDKSFEYLIQMTNLKVESLLLLTKLQEICDYVEN